MKYLLIALALSSSFIGSTQITVNPEVTETTASLSAEARIQMQQRLNVIDKDISKLDKSIQKESKHINSNEENIREAQRNKTINEQTQADRVKQLAKVKSEINGLDLNALETKINRLENSRKKLENSNSRAEKSIVKKKAQIERLLTEISNLESGITKNSNQIKDNSRNIQQTNEVITKNGLVEKQARAENLEKEINDLKNKHQRIDRKILKAQDAIGVSNQKILTSESQTEIIKDERLNLENLLGTGSKVIN